MAESNVIGGNKVNASQVLGNVQVGSNAPGSFVTINLTVQAGAQGTIIVWGYAATGGGTKHITASAGTVDYAMMQNDSSTNSVNIQYSGSSAEVTSVTSLLGFGSVTGLEPFQTVTVSLDDAGLLIAIGI